MKKVIIALGTAISLFAIASVPLFISTINAKNNKIDEIKAQRDLLSDCIRTYADSDDSTIIRLAEYYLIEVNCNEDSLRKWVYCY